MLDPSPFTILQHPPSGASWSSHPKVVSIEITGRCQLRCHHCFNESGPDNNAELPLFAIQRILDEALSWGVKVIRISGGEPTYHRQFRQVVEACVLRELRIAMNTHGVYSQETLEYLKMAPIEQFLISVEGLETANDAIRGRGSFRRAIRSCVELRAAGQQVMIACHIGETNAGDSLQLIELAAQIGVDIKFSPLRPVGRARREMPNEIPRPETYLRVVGEVTRARRKHPDIKIFTDFDILDEAVASDACQKNPGMTSCKAGRTMININYDGAIYPCAFFVTSEKEFSAGSIYDGSLLQAWQNSPAFEPFRIHNKSATCQSCSSYQRTCAGGCPAIAHFTTGYLDAHDPTCIRTAVTEEVK